MVTSDRFERVRNLAVRSLGSGNPMVVA